MGEEFQYKYLIRPLLRKDQKERFGVHNRRYIKLTLAPETMDRIERLVEVAPGKFGSVLVDLAVALFYEFVTEGDNLDEVIAELRRISVTDKYMIRNSSRILRLLRT